MSYLALRRAEDPSRRVSWEFFSNLLVSWFRSSLHFSRICPETETLD
jgi:hypothetical protein